MTMKQMQNLKLKFHFLKVPDAIVKIYYKKPDKIKIKNENGISLVPKETVSISLYSLVNSHYQALDGGSDNGSGDSGDASLNFYPQMKTLNWYWLPLC